MRSLREAGDTVARALARAPRWLALCAGAGCAAVGLVLAFRPFASLAVLLVVVAVALAATGLAELFHASRAEEPFAEAASALLWLVAAVLVLAQPDLSLDLLRVILGVVLCVTGVLRTAAALTDRESGRLIAGLLGAASVVFGVLALTWPDATLLVVAVLFGVHTFLFGCRQAVDAVRRGRAGGRSR
ncbi:HdeD family acid-resistance protein [Streptomyces sp. MS191]|uniref:HdeD family acid-resistance protein n=1 Tax=Streptomyces sp. ms191 TaxID=1827978 RepID=UPI00164EE41F|nr:DUF308 domain-containing protein [Streptomyces sp. ms191]